MYVCGIFLHTQAHALDYYCCCCCRLYGSSSRDRLAQLFINSSSE